jgi:hypothetical protein
MAVKNFHIWVNSILMTLVTFFLYRNFEQSAADHERISNHETRITVLESKKRDDDRTSMVFFKEQAILPQKEKDKKKAI